MSEEEKFTLTKVSEGPGYDPDESRRLGKIQQRFARLYAATQEGERL